jgi:hypothetical protein
MVYRTDARSMRETSPDWLVQGNRRAQAYGFLLAACVLGAFGVATELEARCSGRWTFDGAVTHIPMPGFDPGLTVPPASCRYIIPHRISDTSYCHMVAPFELERDPLLGCPSPEDLRILLELPLDQPIERLDDQSSYGIE